MNNNIENTFDSTNQTSHSSNISAAGNNNGSQPTITTTITTTSPEVSNSTTTTMKTNSQQQALFIRNSSHPWGYDSRLNRIQYQTINILFTIVGPK